MRYKMFDRAHLQVNFSAPGSFQSGKGIPLSRSMTSMDYTKGYRYCTEKSGGMTQRLRNKPLYGWEIAIACVLLLCISTCLHAAVPAKTPKECIKNMLDKVIAIQTDKDLQGRKFIQKRRRAIKLVIKKNFDSCTMAKNALGDMWQKLNRQQREKFTDVFRSLFLDSYTSMVLNFLGKENVRYTKEKYSPQKALVQTVIVRPDGQIPVEYLLKPTKDRWLVYDVVIDGVSIVKNYQRSFLRVIKRRSFKTLLEKMEEQAKINKETDKEQDN